jgi:alkyl hydroperoxide reductase subunit AhpC
MLRINDQAPNFTAEISQGTINFHEWMGNGWASLFSHPKDFTPVCTPEPGYMAGLQPEFEKRNCKIKKMLSYPMSTGRNFDEVLRILDSIKLTAEHKVAATPVNWKQGDGVIILPTVSKEEAKQKYPRDWKAPRPHLRIVPQPR